MIDLTPGHIFFELSFADKDFQLPLIRTLVYLGEGEWSDPGDGSPFLLVSGCHPDSNQKNILLLDESQANELLDHSGLAARLKSLTRRIEQYEQLLE
ncbi:MAG: hypothetical protein KF800_07700 [Lysobacter sp.]|nr:hypothetical protein [Lysobacter sp.]